MILDRMDHPCLRVGCHTGPGPCTRAMRSTGFQVPDPETHPEHRTPNRVLVPEGAPGPEDLEASGSQILEPTSDPDSQHTTRS
jgi:hypothetical protein